MSGQQAFVLGSHMSGVHLGEYLAGLNWLRLNWYVRRNVILGDEMGLGKTVQASRDIRRDIHRDRQPCVCMRALAPSAYSLGEYLGGSRVQALAMLQSLRNLEGIGGPFLIIAPLSTVPHWEREIATWTDM